MITEDYRFYFDHIMLHVLSVDRVFTITRRIKDPFCFLTYISLSSY